MKIFNIITTGIGTLPKGCMVGWIEAESAHDAAEMLLESGQIGKRENLRFLNFIERDVKP